MYCHKFRSEGRYYNTVANSRFVAMAKPKYQERGSESERVGTELIILDLNVLRQMKKNENIRYSNSRSKFCVRYLTLLDSFSIINKYPSKECLFGQVPFNISSFVMDETEIVGYQHTSTSDSRSKVIVLNFSPMHSVLYDKS